MIFEQETIGFQILDVLFFEQGYTKKYNSMRNFDALSFRIEADTVIEYKSKHLEFTDNSIGFFPSDVDYTRITNKDKVIVVHFKAFNYHINEIEYFYPLDYNKYHVLFEEILSVWNKKNVSYKHEASAILCRIFSELYKDNKKLYNSKSKIALSIQYINENCLKNDFSLTNVAKKSFISDTYLRKLFKAELGVSPKQYVIHRRINYAASLIISGYHTLQEISELCGYNDYKHFSVEFKKVMGTSPSKYSYNFEEQL